MNAAILDIHKCSFTFSECFILVRVDWRLDLETILGTYTEWCIRCQSNAGQRTHMCAHKTRGNFKSPVHLLACFREVGGNCRTRWKPMQMWKNMRRHRDSGLSQSFIHNQKLRTFVSLLNEIPVQKYLFSFSYSFTGYSLDPYLSSQLYNIV